METGRIQVLKKTGVFVLQHRVNDYSLEKHRFRVHLPLRSVPGSFARHSPGNMENILLSSTDGWVKTLIKTEE